MQVISLLFVLFNAIFTIYLGGVKFVINREVPDLNCPEDIEITKAQAYADYHSESSLNLMGCYCDEHTTVWALWTLIPHNFNEISEEKLGKSDYWNYCGWLKLLWFLKEILLFFIKTSAVFINEIVAGFFLYLGKFQKKHTKIEEQETAFIQIFVQEFINMGIIVLATSFDYIGFKQAMLGAIAPPQKVFDGFEPNWYMSYGNKICTFVFLSSFLQFV